LISLPLRSTTTNNSTNEGNILHGIGFGLRGYRLDC
jgi:hypothetical protein